MASMAKLKPIGLVANRQLQGGNQCCPFLVSADVDVLASWALICQAVHHPGIAVEVEDDGCIFCEQTDPFFIAEAMWMFAGVDQFKQVDAVDMANLELWEVLKEEVDGRQCFMSANVTARSHNEIRILPNIGAEFRPDADALGAVDDCSVHIEILEVVLFIRNNDIDVI